MKLKTLIFLEEGGMSYPSMGMGYGPMTSQDTKLRPMPDSIDNTESWDGITEGDGWFLYREANNWHNRQSGASITITEGEPHRIRIKIKTKGLKKSSDTNSSLNERVKNHTDKVSRAWITAAKKIKNTPELNEIGSPMERSWTDCFREALEDPKVKPFIEGCSEEKISAMVDPVNFTPRV